MKPQKLREFVEDGRGVSPVVGVALLIAITVILAAVIGFVVLDTSASSTQAKNARLDFDNSSTNLEISHEGGDSFNTTNLVIKKNGALINSSNATFSGGGEFGTGDVITYSGTVNSTDTFVVVWQDPNSDREVQIGKAEIE